MSSTAYLIEQEVDGERILDLGYLALVASKSEPGVWHEVRDDHCTCAGFGYRQRCRHIAAVETLRTPPEPQPAYVPTGPAVWALVSLPDD